MPKCEHEHDHSHEESKSGFEQTLFPCIDTTKGKNSSFCDPHMCTWYAFVYIYICACMCMHANIINYY